jgi:bifunctional UDP-N-acetylglucosamine pyrophosphorylase/glucosamine-1-phosphate N-acetyltransferase
VQNEWAAVIMAAGQSKRMKSGVTKVLHRIAGRAVLCYTLEAVRSAGIQRIILVVGRQSEDVRREFGDGTLEFAEQEKQLGTGHAAYTGLRGLAGFDGDILVLCGDVPLVSRETLIHLMTLHREKCSKVTLLTTRLHDPTGYGRIVRGQGDVIVKIVEEKEASEEERQIREINSGIMCFEAGFIAGVLDELLSEKKAGEYYLTDAIGLTREKGLEVHGFAIENALEVQGINDRRELSLVEEVIMGRIRDHHMTNGVTLVNPPSVLIDRDVVIGEDTVVHQGAILEGRTKIGKGCWIGPFSRILDSNLGDHVHMEGWNYLKGVQLKDDSRLNAYESAGEEEK